jgi:hypothetical protein
MDYTLKFFGYFGGPILVDFMLSGFKRGLKCNTQDDIGEWLNEATMLTWAKRSAQAAMVFDVNKYNVTDLFMVHTRLMEIQRSTESQEERHSVMEKHIHGMLTEIPWTVGKDAYEVFEGTAIGESDQMAAELNSEEIMLVSAGQRVPALDDIPDLKVGMGFNREGTDANAKSH